MELEKLLAADPDIMRILSTVRDLGLSDSWLAAGTLRNFIWNKLSHLPAFDETTDVDIVFFDRKVPYEKTKKIEAQLRQVYPTYNWELKNQKDMHGHSPHTLPYTSSKDAISKYPERCTAIGARLDEEGQLEVFLPYGLEDILNFVVRPTPHFKADKDRMALYQKRLAEKIGRPSGHN